MFSGNGATVSEKGFSVRTVRWRYISYYDGSEELYDHDKDPLEWDNLAGKPEFAEAKQSLKAFVPPHPAPGKKPPAPPKPEATKGSKKKSQPEKVAEVDPLDLIP